MNHVSIVSDLDTDSNVLSQTHTVEQVSGNLELIAELTQAGYDHLKSEGFSDDHIQKMIDMDAVRWADPDAAKSLGFKWKREKLEGLYFPAVKHLRPATLLKDNNGKVIKYLFGKGWKAESQGETVETEGGKDALAGTLIGGIPTFAKPSTTFYKRPEFRSDSVKVSLYDSDAWTNPSVLLHLVGASIHQGTRVQAVPHCEGFKKAGLVEFFKAGHSPEDYRQLIKSAMTAQRFLIEAPSHWGEQDGEQKQKLLKAVAKQAARLSWKETEKNELVDVLAKGTGETKKDITAILREELAQASYKANVEENHKARPECQVGNETLEVHLLNRLFKDGETPYITINNAFFRYSGEGYWLPVPEDEIKQVITDGCKEAWEAVQDKEGRWGVAFKHGSKREMDSTFAFCAANLGVKPKDNSHLKCFYNGTVDMRTGILREHSANDYLTSRIEGNYAPTDEIPAVLKQFIISSYGEEQIEFWRAAFSMYLDPTCFYGKFIHIQGPSGSGKGTMIRLIQSFFNEGGVASLGSFLELVKKEDRHSNLTGVSLVAFPDIVGYQQCLGPFYELVDNGALNGRALFVPNSYSKVWNLRFISGSVLSLKIENAGEGWDRRVIYVVTKRPKGLPADRGLGEKLLAAKAEIISWALGIDKKRRNAILEDPSLCLSESAALRLRTSIAGDSVKSFLDDCFRPCEGKDTIRQTDLFYMYKAYCEETGNKALSPKQFNERLESSAPEFYSERRQTKGSNRQWIPAGLKNVEVLPEIFTASPFNPNHYVCDLNNTAEGSFYGLPPAENEEDSPEEEHPKTWPSAEAHADSEEEPAYMETRAKFYAAADVEEMAEAIRHAKSHLTKDERQREWMLIAKFKDKKTLIDQALRKYPELKDLRVANKQDK